MGPVTNIVYSYEGTCDGWLGSIFHGVPGGGRADVREFRPSADTRRYHLEQPAAGKYHDPAQPKRPNPRRFRTSGADPRRLRASGQTRTAGSVFSDRLGAAGAGDIRSRPIHHLVQSVDAIQEWFRATSDHHCAAADGRAAPGEL